MMTMMMICGFISIKVEFSLCLAQQPNVGQGHLILEVFLDHIQWHITVGRTPLDERSAR